MKIIFLMTDLAMGGAEIQVVRLCKFITKRKNHRVIIVSMMKIESKEMKEELESMGIKVYSLGMTKGKASLKAYMMFLSVVRREMPAVIHSHMFHANILSRMSRPFLRGTKIINTIHGEEEFIGKRRIIYRLTGHLSDYDVTCGRILYNQALSKGISQNDKLRIIYNGVDTNHYLYSINNRIKQRLELNADDNFIWMTVARLSKEKNQDYLIDEFVRVSSVEKSTKLVIVGDGPLKKHLIKKARRCGLQDRIIFTGKREDVEKLLCAADAFVLSSEHEGLPLSLQEAGAIGLPLISTDVGGCKELINNNYNGFLCESGKVGALSEKMLKLMRYDNNALMEMGKHSRMLIIKKFEMSNVLRDWERLYCELG